MIFRLCSRLSRLWKMSSKFPCKNIKYFRREALSYKSEQGMLYEKAIEVLNSLQTIDGSTATSCKKVTKQRVRITQTEKFDEIKHLPVDNFKKLAAIHVAGTKGKGSVCAFCESILRKSGYKTGFYSSPHVFEVRERMRVNGRSITKDLFTKYFWECWENFEVEKKRYYKTFLVFMAFHVFLKEKVDVAVVEVHCGGEYDVTNILRHPVVCGVTLLDKDHLQTLGGTVESIAWHKAGIFKPGAPCFTVPQDPVSMKVLQARAAERQTSLQIVPDLPANADDEFPTLGIEGKHQHQNASLAVHLCHSWIERRNADGKISSTENEETSNPETNLPRYAKTFSLPESFLEGLASTVWPGRTQCVERDNFTFYLDGAHTRKSIEACSEWFCEKSEKERNAKSHLTIAKVLIFNFKGARDATSLLEPLVKCDFDYVVFCPNLLKFEAQSATSDTFHFYQDTEEDRKKCFKNQEIWKKVLRSDSTSPSLNAFNLNSKVFPCVSDAFHWVVGNRNDSCSDRKSDTLHDALPHVDHMQVFVTGSLYLVGMMLKLLEHENVDYQ